MDDRINIVLSGPGLIGRQHAKLVVEHPACSLGAIVAPLHPDNVSFAKKCAVPLFTSLDDAFGAQAFDAAIISSPNEFHVEQAMACIERRIPALVEKPVTHTLKAARDLADYAEAEGVAILVGHHRTYSPLLEVADVFLHSLEFGRAVALQGNALFYKPAHYFADGPWRAKVGGGPILINLIHEVGLMRFFFGEIVSVFANAANAVRRFEVEDSVAINLSFANGALGTFLLSDTAASNKSWEMTSGENPSYPYYSVDNCYHFAGTNGSLDFPSMKARYYGDGVARSWWIPFEERQIPAERANPLRRQLDHFVDVITGKAEPRVSPRDGYQNMIVVEAIKRSIFDNRAVYIADISQRSSFDSM